MKKRIRNKKKNQFRKMRKREPKRTYKDTLFRTIFGGKDDLDLELVLNKLYSLFGIKKLLLEGGSEINGSFQREGLIDELSLIIAPVVAEQDDKCLFEHSVLENYKITGSAVYDKSIHRLTCHRYYK